MAGDRSQGIAVDFGVNRRRQNTSVTQELSDIRQGRPGPQHLRRSCVPQPVRMDSPEARPLGSIGHHVAHRAGAEMPMRGLDPYEYRPTLSAGRATVLQIFGNRSSDVCRQWDAFDTVRLTAHDDLAGSPINIVQPELGHLTRPQAETDQHCQDGDVAATAPRGSGGRREEAADLVRIQTFRQSDQSPAGSRWHGRDQGPRDDAIKMEEAEQGPKGCDRQLRRAATLSRTTGHRKGENVSCGQMLDIQGEAVGRESALQEWSHHVEIDARRGGSQGALDGQVAPEPIEHCVQRTETFFLEPWRQELQPLKIVKDGMYRSERGISRVAGGPTVMQKAVQIT